MATREGAGGAEAGHRPGSFSNADADGFVNYYRPSATADGAQVSHGELLGGGANRQAPGNATGYHAGGPRIAPTKHSAVPPRQAQTYASSVLRCDSPYTLEARSRIIDVLRLNREFKHVVKQRIGYDARKARATLHRSFKQILAQRAARKLRKEGRFQATVYLEIREHEEQPQPRWRVEVFGEFTTQPWQERIPCRYDH